MATTHTDTNVNSLVINKLNKTEYDNLSQVSDTELYLVEEQVDNTVTQGSTNPVQSGTVYEALREIGSAINDGTTLFVKNNRTVGTTSANQALDKTITIPNDIIMCKMSDGIVYDSYITYTKIKQYLPDYPYYSDDLDWEIGGNPPMRANIIADNYYFDVDTNHIFVADENLELLDITSSVVIHGDANKLYCNVDTNILYRYDGINFVALTSNFSGDYNDLINNPFFVANNRLKYTDSPNTWVIPLMDDFSNNQNDYSKQILIYNGAGGISPSMNIINHIADNDLLDYLPANYTIQDFVKAIADYYIQYKNDLLSGHNYFSVYGKARRIRISPPEFYNYRFDYIKYNNDYIAKIEISALDSSYSAVGWYNNTTWTFEETTLKQVAFSGSYNDLTDKLQNATTSAAGLMSASDKTQVANLTVSQISIGATLFCGRVTGSGNYLEIFIPCALPSNASNVTLSITSMELYFDGTKPPFSYDSITTNSIIPLIGITFDLHLTSSMTANKTFFVLLNGTLTFNR